MSDVNIVEPEAQEELSKSTNLQTDMATTIKDTVEIAEVLLSNQLQHNDSKFTTLANQNKQSNTSKPTTRPDPALISEFDPFAPNAETSVKPSTEKTIPATRIPVAIPPGSPNPSKATGLSNPSEVSHTAPSQTPNEGQGTQTTHAPRKAGNHSQTAQHSNDSPSISRQKTTRTRSMEEADNQHRHAGALISKGESRTNPKPKELAFDFQGFLAQLRTKQAEPIQKYLKR